MDRKPWKKGLGRKVALAVVLLLAAMQAGCGSGSSDSASIKAPEEASGQFQNPEGPGRSEPVATFGKESGDAERSEASAVLTANLAAREKADFAKQCGTLGKRGLESVLGPWKKGDPSETSKCTAALKGFAEPLANSESVRKDTLNGEIAALRIKRDEAYALYHGNDGNDYAMPMEREGGVWKVGAILTIELPSGSAKSESSQENEG